MSYWDRYARQRLSRRGAIRGFGLGVTGLAGAALIGCGSDDEDGGGTPAPGGGGGATATTPAGTPGAQTPGELSDATLTAAIGSDVGSLDPQSLGGTGGGNWPNASTHFGGAGLTITDQDTKEFLPNVAESWEESPDHLTWTFNLRQDVFFHNDEQLMAEDVKFSIDRNIGQAEYNPDFQAGYSAQFTGVVDSVEVIDDFTVQVNMKQPDIIFLRRPLFLVPKTYIEEQGDDGFAAHPIGAGYFKFVSRVPDSEIVSQRWEKYHLGFESPGGLHPPFVRDLVQKVIPDNQARLAALQAGEVNLIHNVASDIARQLESDEDFLVHYLPGDQPIMIEINTAMETNGPSGDPNPFKDKRVRLAAMHAVDVDAIINNILTGREQYTFGSARGSFGFPEDLVDQRIQYDPERAKQLLAEAGYPDGFDTYMYGPIGRWPNSLPVMQAAAQFLGEVGIRAQVQELQYQEVTTRYQERTIGPLVFFGMAGGDDPGANFRYNYHSTGNYLLGPITPEEDQAEVDRLVEASEQEYDPEARRELIGETITKFYQGAKAIWLYEPVTVVVTDSNWQWDIWADSLANPEYWNIRPV